MLLVLAIAGCWAPEASDSNRGPGALPEPAGAVQLARDGTPTVTIRVGPAVAALPDPRFHENPSRYAGQNNPWSWTEDQRIAAAAYDLRDVLTRTVCGGKEGCGYVVAAWTPEDNDGIRVGRPADFGLDTPFSSTNVLDREQYLVRTVSGNGVLALGADAGSVEDAVWELARTLGYRYYLPTPTWEILPETQKGTLTLPATDVLLRPGFVNRRLVGAKTREEGRDLQAWATRNAFVGSFQAKGVEGQYGPIYDAAEDWFRKNPGAVSASSRPKEGAKSTKVKFCPGYVDKDGVSVLDVITDTWARPHLAITDPTKFDNDISRDALPLHHGDSAFWAGCTPEAKGGATPADRVVVLANGVLDRVGDSLGDRVVSVMGYREPFPGPLKTQVDPRIYVWMYGNGYLGTPFDQALATWKQAGASQFGTYAYWTAPAFQVPDEGAPFLAPKVVARQLVDLRNQGFSSLWIESDGGWGPGGLWKWLLLDVARAPVTDADTAVAERKEDVLLHAFPPEARPHVSRVLEQFDLDDHRFLLSPDLVAELYAELGAARDKSAGPARERVEDLLTYVRYLELFLNWRTDGSYDPLVDHAFCTDDRRMTDAALLWKETPEKVQANYQHSHRGRTPAENHLLNPCPPPDFDGWIRDRPQPQLGAVRWWTGKEGSWARATRFPGTAKTGTFEGDIHGNPRNSQLWKVWVDPADGLTVTQACQGIHDRTNLPPDVVHITSRLLGRSEIALRDPATGALACRVTMSPDRDARDVTFVREGTRVAQSRRPIKSACKPEPRELVLDTGTPEVGDTVSCDPAVFAKPGVYDFDTENHRTGLDYSQLTGPIWASRWESPFTPHEERLPEVTNPYRYFYVPRGQETVAVWTSGAPCSVVRDGVKAHDVEIGGGGPGYRMIPTSVGGVRRDGEIWAFAACRDVFLVNVPPVVAPKRDLLLVPCGFVSDPARAEDVRILGVDPKECR